MNAFEKGQTVTRRLQYAKAADVAKLFGGAGSAAKGGVTVTPDERINALIIEGSKEMIDQAKKLIETVDVPVHQCMMEAKIVEVKTDATKSIGFKWQGKIGSDGEYSTFESLPVFSTKEYFAVNPDSGLYQEAFTGQQGDMFGLGDFYRENLLFKATFSALETRSESK
ncbi:MAG TPA: hypothetical protein DCG57_04680, partial [Candidatus Riflebacteria bacterium]|nr:hypothetical protein [Candidatus Riflebacteria bacterium]